MTLFNKYMNTKDCLTKLWRYFTLAFIALFTGIFTVFSYASEPDYWVLTNLEPPFVQKNVRGYYEGYMVDIVNGILEEAAINQKMLAAPWDRVLKEAQSKKNILIFGLVRTPDREQQFYWISPLLSNIVGLFSLDGENQLLQNLTDLDKSKVVGVLDGDFRYNLLLQAGVEHIQVLNNWGQGVTMLLDEKIDVLFFSSMGIQYICKQAKRDCQQVKRVFNYQQTTSYLALSKMTDPSIVEKLKEAAERYKRSPDFYNISHKWIDFYNKNNNLSMHLANGVVNLWPEEQ